MNLKLQTWKLRAPTPLLLAHEACGILSSKLFELWAETTSKRSRAGIVSIARAANKAYEAKPRTAQAKRKQTLAIRKWQESNGKIIDAFLNLKSNIDESDKLLAAVQEDFGAVAQGPFRLDPEYIGFASAHEWVTFEAYYQCSLLEDSQYEHNCPPGVDKPKEFWQCSKEKMQFFLAPDIFVNDAKDWHWGISMDEHASVDVALEQELCRAWKQFYPNWKPNEEERQQAENLISNDKKLGRVSTEQRDDLFLKWKKTDGMTDTEIILAWNRLPDEERRSICPTVSEKLPKTDRGRDRIKKAINRAERRAAAKSDPS